jgi:hypothetical protein
MENFVTHQIGQYLTETFELPIVADVTQHQNEQVVSYTIDTIRVRNEEGGQKFELGVTCYWRNPNGYDSIGLLTQRLNNNPANEPEFEVNSTSGTETIEYIQKTEIILSKSITIHLTANKDVTRERIKSIIIS